MANRIVHKQEVTVFASAARTATATSSSFTNLYHSGIRLTLVATALADTPGITMKLQGYNSASATWIDYITDAQVTTASPTTSQLLQFPGAAVSANASANDYLPRTWRVVVTAADGDSITYSVGAELLP